MHLQQTKYTSRKTGGPQYYLQEPTEEALHYLRHKKVVPVALVTPYGATPSEFRALSGDAKLGPDDAALTGRVGHERIQQAQAGESIGEAIRRWYRLPSGDFERVAVEMPIIDSKFYLTPIGYKYRSQSRTTTIQKPEFPLSFNHRLQSQLWRKQLERVGKANVDLWRWSLNEICRVSRAHLGKRLTSFVKEEDLLRASGPLNILGVEFGPLPGKGLDCQGTFRFLDYEPYSVPIELKKLSSGFKYQQKKYSPEQLSRRHSLCTPRFEECSGQC